MSFYKKQDGQLVSAEFVDGPGYTLSEAGKDEHTYPVDGWYWFADLDAAIAGMANVTDGVAVVTRRQAKQALLKVGLLDDVDAAIATQGGRAAQIDWADATEFRRDWPALIALQPALGLTDQQVDDLFTLAATL